MYLFISVYIYIYISRMNPIHTGTSPRLPAFSAPDQKKTHIHIHILQTTFSFGIPHAPQPVSTTQ